MSTSEFDERLRQKMDEGDFEFVPAQWSQMAQDLDASEHRKEAPARKRYWLMLVGAMASTAAVWASVALFLKPGTDTPAPGSVTTVTVPVARGTQPVTAAPAESAIASATVAATTGAAAVTRTSQTDKQENTNASPAVAVNTTVPITATDTAALAVSATASDIFRSAPSKNGGMQQQPTDEETSWSNQDFVHPHMERDQARTSLGVSGGLNYGTSRAGYTLGVNARRKISRKFYVEGDLALVNNTTQNANTLSTSEYNKISADITSTPGNSNPPSNAFIASAVKNASTKEALNSLYYLQVAPSFGYHVSRQLSLSAGADIQKMLQHNSGETAISLADNEIKLIPETDIGITGKVEYGITPKLLTGLSYREGINAMMDSKYMNRRYLQVQVKFLIFNK